MHRIIPLVHVQRAALALVEDKISTHRKSRHRQQISANDTQVSRYKLLPLHHHTDAPKHTHTTYSHTLTHSLGHTHTYATHQADHKSPNTRPTQHNIRPQPHRPHTFSEYPSPTPSDLCGQKDRIDHPCSNFKQTNKQTKQTKSVIGFTLSAASAGDQTIHTDKCSAMALTVSFSSAHLRLTSCALASSYLCKNTHQLTHTTKSTIHSRKPERERSVIRRVCLCTCACV